MRRGLFDVGFEDYGRPGGGLPHEAVFAGMGSYGMDGLGGMDVSPGMVSLAQARSYSRPGAWEGDIHIGKPAVNLKERLSRLHARLRIVGLRKEMAPPMVYDIDMARQIVEFKRRVGIPRPATMTTPYSAVTQDTWTFLNYMAAMVNERKFNPLNAVAAPSGSGAEQIAKTSKGTSVSTTQAMILGSASDAYGAAAGWLSSLFGYGPVSEKTQGDSVPVKPKVPSMTGAAPSTTRPSTSNQDEANAQAKAKMTSLKPSVPGMASYQQTKDSQRRGLPPGNSFEQALSFGKKNPFLLIAVAFILVIIARRAL